MKESGEAFVVTEHGGICPGTESPRFVAKHLSAYEFARGLVENKSVLEVGFGDGYGSVYLAQKARQVAGIDLFEKNVLSANEKYLGSVKNVEFKVGNATEIPFESETFDVAVSFQVIEHIPQAQLLAYVESIKRVLKSDGVAIISTLNLKKNMKSSKTYEKSPHYDKEFLPNEFYQLLQPCFEKVDLYGLHTTFKHSLYERLKKIGLLNRMPPRWNFVKSYYHHITTKDFFWSNQMSLDACLDMMAVCYKGGKS